MFSSYFKIYVGLFSHLIKRYLKRDFVLRYVIYLEVKFLAFQVPLLKVWYRLPRYKGNTCFSLPSLPTPPQPQIMYQVMSERH